VDHTRQVIAYIDSLCTYLLNLDTAVRRYAESQDPADLDPGLICRQSPCPSSAQLIDLIRADGALAARLAPLPALQSALETGFGALRQRAEAGGDATPPERELAGFDKSAIEQIHRILIETGREELSSWKRAKRHACAARTCPWRCSPWPACGWDWRSSGCTAKASA